MKLILVARSEDELEHALEELLAQGSVLDGNDVLLFCCDLRNPAKASRLVSASLHRFSRLDILINNAGIIVVGPAQNQPLQAYRDAMEVHFFAALQCIYAALPGFL